MIIITTWYTQSRPPHLPMVEPSDQSGRPIDGSQGKAKANDESKVKYEEK